MPKQKTDDLLKLVASLNRAEKRHFRLFVKRNQQANAEILFLQLFDILERTGEYDEEYLLKRIEGIKKSQLSNLKAHLYKQLLTSLRLLNRNKDEAILLRENMDYARILYNKGLYRQSLDVLDKTKKRARDIEVHTVALEIAQFEKLIEGQYITRSIESRAEELGEECADLAMKISDTDAFSNLALRLYGLYLKLGLVSNEQDFFMVKSFFRGQLPKAKYEDLDFWGKIYYCQSYHWMHLMCHEYPSSYRFTHRWVELFDNKERMIEANAPLYLKGIHNNLAALFNMWQYDKFMEQLSALELFPHNFDLTNNVNVAGLYYLYQFDHQIRRHYMEGTFKEGLGLVPQIMQVIEENTYHWDDHRIMIFHYRIACLYFGSGDNDTAIDYLNEIINQRSPNYRSDIQAYARILSLICHFEMGNVQLVEYQVKSVYRFLAKVEHLQETQQLIFRFLRRIPRIREEQLRDEFIKLKGKLDAVTVKPFESRPFTFLDIPSWLEAKIENKTVQQVIRARFEARREE
jgi:tetratricopeptide (TPR) repeat protein